MSHEFFRMFFQDPTSDARRSDQEELAQEPLEDLLALCLQSGRQDCTNR